MFQRAIPSLCFTIMISSASFSQGGHYGGHNENVSELCKILQTNNFASNRAADDALDKILSVTGMSKNFTLYPCSDIENCAAVTFNGDRYILYDKEFMEVISNNTGSWSNLSILAHEIGHHVNGHTLDLVVYAAGGRDAPTLAKKREEELEADEYSGFVMQKLGASLEQAQSAVKLYASDGDDSYSTHPNKAKRLYAIKNGFERAKKTEKTKVETKVIYVEKETDKVIKEEFKSSSNITSGSLYDNRDGKEYKTVKIGNQTWMAENLAYKAESGNYWAYDNDYTNVSKFGYLYDWETANEVCPANWHLPTKKEWFNLIHYLGGKDQANSKMKGKFGWKNNGTGNNESGFNGLPGGIVTTVYNGKKFGNINHKAHWWSSTNEYGRAMTLVLNGHYESVDYGSSHIGGGVGVSIRCIKD